MSELEARIRVLLERRELEQAAATTLRGYGPEVLGFLAAQLGDRQAAEDTFAMVAEDLWRALPGLELQNSMRAYVYALARNARARFLARDQRRARRGVPLSQAPELVDIVVEVRTQTAAHLQTGNKLRFAALRARLDADEQALLTLRIDRGLSWEEIGAVFEGEGDAKTRSARHRKRFQLLKDKLTRWAREEGLLPER